VQLRKCAHAIFCEAAKFEQAVGPRRPTQHCLD
jgi:hypothetical protein